MGTFMHRYPRKRRKKQYNCKTFMKVEHDAPIRNVRMVLEILVFDRTFYHTTL